MTALDARRVPAEPVESAPSVEPLGGLVADAREVAVAMAAMSQRPRAPRESTVRIPAKALGVVSGLAPYGD
jgi:hypothetical protein